MADETQVKDGETVGCLDSLADAMNIAHSIAALLERVHVLPDNPVTHFLMDHAKDAMDVLKKLMKK